MNTPANKVEEMTVRDAAINHRTETGRVTLWLPGHQNVQILSMQGQSRGILARHQHYFRTLICDVKTGKAAMVSLKADSTLRAVWHS